MTSIDQNATVVREDLGLEAHNGFVGRQPHGPVLLGWIDREPPERVRFDEVP